MIAMAMTGPSRELSHSNVHLKHVIFGDFPLPSLITGGYVQLKISEISTSTSIGEALRAWFQQL